MTRGKAKAARQARRNVRRKEARREAKEHGKPIPDPEQTTTMTIPEHLVALKKCMHCGATTTFKDPEPDAAMDLCRECEAKGLRSPMRHGPGWNQ